MTDKAYELLTKPRRIKNSIRGIDIAISDLRLMMLPGAIRYDKDTIQSTPKDPFEKYVERLSSLEQRRQRMQHEYLDAEDQILKRAERLDDLESLIIIMRFINCNSFEEIASEIGKSERQLFRYYKKAIEKIENDIECQLNTMI